MQRLARDYIRPLTKLQEALALTQAQAAEPSNGTTPALEAEGQQLFKLCVLYSILQSSMG